MRKVGSGTGMVKEPRDLVKSGGQIDRVIQSESRFFGTAPT